MTSNSALSEEILHTVEDSALAFDRTAFQFSQLPQNVLLLLGQLLGMRYLNANPSQVIPPPSSIKPLDPFGT